MIVGRQFRRAVLVLVGRRRRSCCSLRAQTRRISSSRVPPARQREIALRAALGATRGRITRQLLTESVLLAVDRRRRAGCCSRTAASSCCGTLGETTIPRLDDVRIDGPVLAFTALIALGSGVLFGLLPAFRASRPDAAEALKAGGRGTGAGHDRAGSAVGAGGRRGRAVARVARGRGAPHAELREAASVSSSGFDAGGARRRSGPAAASDVPGPGTQRRSSSRPRWSALGSCRA